MYINTTRIEPISKPDSNRFKRGHSLAQTIQAIKNKRRAMAGSFVKHETAENIPAIMVGSKILFLYLLKKNINAIKQNSDMV
jgi:hypothetical protein